MMKNKKFLIIALVVGLTLAGAAVLGVGVASAYFGGKSKEAVSQKLAEKLGVSSDKVSTAMDEIQVERQAERKASNSAKLDKAVSDRVITAEQKQKILDKMDETQQKRESEREEMQKWQDENNIDWEKLHSYGIGMRFGGRGHGGGMM